MDRYPPIKPNISGMLQVDDIHSIYWEESGNPDGIPVFFLHGGPGSATEENHRTFFDPAYYRIILFDQRGCGKSIPTGCLVNNTIWDLIDDINQLRLLLNVDRFLIFGGSWGSTLALTYAIKYPENVMGLILRGIFLCMQEELDWFYKDGANQNFEQARQIFLKQLPEEKKGDPIAGYHVILNSKPAWKRKLASAAWVLWEFAHLHSKQDIRLTALLSSKVLFYIFAALYAKQNHTIASIENHYFYNHAFFENDNWIIENMDRLKNIPGFIIQGENDQICPWQNACKLHESWPSSTFLLVPDAGHASNEKGILDALISSTEFFKVNEYNPIKTTDAN